MQGNRYNYKELAYDLYSAADDLLEDLVSLRKKRGMTQVQLADEMGVTQSYISQIENGQKQLVSLLTDYALEVGGRITYTVEPAEMKPEGNRRYTTSQITGTIQMGNEWANGGFSAENNNIEISITGPKHGNCGSNYIVSQTVLSSNINIVSKANEKELEPA